MLASRAPVSSNSSPSSPAKPLWVPPLAYGASEILACHWLGSLNHLRPVNSSCNFGFDSLPFPLRLRDDDKICCSAASTNDALSAALCIALTYTAAASSHSSATIPDARYATYRLIRCIPSPPRLAKGRSSSLRRQPPASPQHSRPGGCAHSVFPTDSSSRTHHSAIPPPLDFGASVNRRPEPARLNQPSGRHHDLPTFTLSPFRPRAAGPALRHVRRLSAARLWNPTNSTPRPHTARKRRPSTPPPPSVPLQHPTFDDSNLDADPTKNGAGSYPLLTLPEQRQTRHSGSTRASLQVERQGSSDNRVSLPNSVRPSYDLERARNTLGSPTASEFGPPSRGQESEFHEVPLKLDKGKGKAIMTAQDLASDTFSPDLEQGPALMEPRYSNVSAGDGIGSALSSTDSSIMGEEVEPDAAGEWGPQHPCYPHLNPHVPIDSPEYASTRIIRVRRDWLLEGDLAPTFSNLYPEILDPAGLSEPEFRRVIEKLNSELIPAFNPYALRNIIDNVLGLVTGWLWDDFGLTGIKSKLNNLENWIEKWNQEMEKTVGSEDGMTAPKIVPLRRTGYMTLDIQIPDPEIAPAPSTHAGDSRTVLPLDPLPPVLTL